MMFWDSRPCVFFKNEGIETSYIALDNETPSGVALISVDQYAENCIVVASGANMLLGQEDIDSMEKRDVGWRYIIDATGNSSFNCRICCTEGL